MNKTVQVEERKKVACTCPSALREIIDGIVREMAAALPIIRMPLAGILNRIEDFRMSPGDGLPISFEEVFLVPLEARESA